MINSFIRNYFVIGVVLFIVTWIMPNVSLGYEVGRSFDPGSFVDHLPALLVTALVLTLLSMIARPVLQLLSAPINFVTLGAFNIVINVFLFWLAANLVDGFSIGTLTLGGTHLNAFFSYAVVAIVFGLVQGLLALIF